jgi:aspartyl-tRNA(Asn)/glutamyl-tRNA(Gln) amidotransferase subunit C
MAESFTSADVQRVAQLARLELTEGEQKLFARQLSDILAYAEQVQDVDTRNVLPSSHPSEAVSPWREDVVQGSLARDEVLAQAPEADPAAGLFKVPRVLA